MVGRLSKVAQAAEDGFAHILNSLLDTFQRASVKLVTIKISHCYNVYRKGCNSYKQCVVSILLQHVFVVTILLQHIILVTMRIGCNNVKIKYLLLQRLRIVVTQILVATMNGICYNWQIFGRDLFDIYRGSVHKCTKFKNDLNSKITQIKVN